MPFPSQDSPTAPRTTRWLAAISLLAVLMLSACGGGASPAGDTTETADSPAAAGTVQSAPSPTATSEGVSGPVQATAEPTATRTVDHSKPAAVVNGEEITFPELYGILERRYGARELDQMITETLIRQEGEKRNITVSEEEVAAEIQKFQEAYPGQDIANIVQSQFGYTMDEFREQIRLSLVVEKILDPQVQPTDDEIEQYYEDNKEQLFKTPTEVDLQVVVADDEQKAQNAAQALRDGKALQEVIDQYGTKADGLTTTSGDPAYTNDQEIDPGLSAAVASLKTGEVTDPVQTQDDKWAVAKLQGKRGGEVKPLNEVRDQVVEQVRDQKLQEAAPAFLQQIRESAEIENQLAEEVTPEAPAPELTPQG